MVPATVRCVVAPTDLTERGSSAVPVACALLPRGGQLHLVHVIEPALVPNPLYAHYSPGRAPTAEERRRQREELQARLLRLAPPEAARQGLAVHAHVLEETSVAAAVCELAQRLDADLVCLASLGRTGFRKSLGTVAARVLRFCPCPVLLLRP